MASRRILCWLALVGLFAGCGYLPGNSADLDGDLDDLALDSDTEEVLRVEKSRGEDRESRPNDLPETLSQGDLGLRLKVGDRFPLQKTVEQRLTQPTDEGVSTGHSRLDLLLSLLVEELRDGHTRLGVRYHRVRYLEQDPEGRTVEYNSTAPPREIPGQARVYAGLIENGFAFWIGPDNRLVELVGFPDFVQRCVRDVPYAQRQAVIEQLAAGRGDNGIASFIDDSIGLLPVSDSKSGRVAVREGLSWELPVRKIDGPVPMLVSTQCKIKGLSDRTAEIDLFGAVSPTNQIEHPGGWKVSVLGGRCLGSCTVDRTTGLPTNSRVERYVDLLMELPDGSQLKQRKEIITTIQAFLEQPHNLAAGEGVRPATYQRFDSPPAADPPATGKRPRSAADELNLFR